MEPTLNRKNIYLSLLDKIQEKIPCALATVADAHGSTPQKPGSSAIFAEKGLLDGTVGGGKVEHKIRQKAVDAIKTGESALCRFELDDDISDVDSAICGGGMTILLDAFPAKHKNVLEQIRETVSGRVPGVLVTLGKSDDSGNLGITRIWITKESFLPVAETLAEDIARSVKEMLDNPTPGDFREVVVHTSPDAEDDYTFLESIVPLPRLVIAGAGHVGKALSHLGKMLGFEVIVWDDREEYASKNNLPDADKILTGNISESLGKLKTEQDTFIVIVTRGHQNDTEVLKQFINTNAAYIGMIGSKKKVMQVREKSIEEGWATSEQWEKIHAPIGLKIGSKTVEEIAVSIAAELIQVRNELNGKNG